MSSYGEEVGRDLDARANGHVWRRAGEHDWADMMAWVVDYHNGPTCLLCGYQPCHHCVAEFPPCCATPETVQRRIREHEAEAARLRAALADKEG